MELKELPESCEQGDGQETVIRLIKATRVPARHAKVMWARQETAEHQYQLL